MTDADRSPMSDAAASPLLQTLVRTFLSDFAAVKGPSPLVLSVVPSQPPPLMAVPDSLP